MGFDFSCLLSRFNTINNPDNQTADLALVAVLDDFLSMPDSAVALAAHPFLGSCLAIFIQLFP